MRVLVVSTVRNEGPYLLEWIAHHRAAGVDDFLIFSNDCEDGSDMLLDALAPAGVTHLRQSGEGAKPVQWRALAASGAHPLMQAADWVMALDCDEFVNLRGPQDGIRALIAACAGADAIVLPWRLFGHNGQARLTDAPTTRTFTRAAPSDCLYPAIASYFKTLYRKRAFRAPGVHRPRAKAARHGPARWVDGSGQALPEAFAEAQGRIMLWGAPIANDLVQLNHYSLRSAESFMLKRARGLPNHATKPVDLSYWVERNFNAVEETSIARMAPATASEHARLAALPGVAALHRAALAWHHARFEALMCDPGELKLYGRLLLAAGSTVPVRATALDLVRRYQLAHAGERG